MRLRRHKGSMTIFATMSLMLVAAVLFTLLEAARFYQMREIATVKTQAMTESVFSNFCIPIWEQYHILALDGEELSLVEEWADAQFDGGNSMLRPRSEAVALSDKLLITDSNGEVYADAVSAYMRRYLPVEILESFGDTSRMCGEIGGAGEMDCNALTKADQAIEEAKKEAKEEAAKDKEVSKDSEISEEETEGLKVENPIQLLSTLLTKGELALVLENPKKVSKAAIKLKTTVSHRKLEKGTKRVDITTDAVDRLLYGRYLTECMGDYSNPSKEHALRYETEYILCGNAKDSDNLRGTINRLIGVREAANLAYLMADMKKQKQALAVSVAIAGVTLSPAATQAVKLGVLTAWALAESILDVRSLLEGQEIPFIKTAKDWTTDIYHLGSYFSGFRKAKKCTKGWNYTRYLEILIGLSSPKQTSYRAMDLQELEIRKLEGYETFKMDHLILDARLVMTYHYQTIFLGMETLTRGKERMYQLQRSASYSYRKAGI